MSGVLLASFDEISSEPMIRQWVVNRSTSLATISSDFCPDDSDTAKKQGEINQIHSSLSFCLHQ
jgi:hypothetical protein